MITFILLVFLPFNIKAEESELWSEEYDAATGDHDLMVETNEAGYNGEGYLGGWNEDGEYANVDITVPKDATYTLIFRYAGGAGDAVRSLKIGEVFEVDQVFFSGTGGWGDF